MKKFFLPLFLIILILISTYIIYNNFIKEREYNVIIFTLDTTRADYVDTGNGAKAKTPNLKSIALHSTVCENAYTTIPITMPAHTSIFTGKYPYEAGVFNNGENYEKNFPTLAEIFKKRGYTTGAVISLGVLLKEHKLNKGFDYYIDDFSKAFPSYFLRAETVTRRGLKLLKKFKGKKFFLWLHYSDPHEPYGPPQYKKIVSIKLNGEVIKSFNLFDTTPMELNIPLKKGENLLTFTNLKTSNFFMAYPLRIKNLETKAEKNKVKIKFKNIKVYRNRKLLVLNNISFIKIYSKTTQNIILTFNVKPNILAKTKKFLYKKEVEYMDKEIGKVLNYLKERKLLKDSILIFVGDHGEGLGEYQENFGHIHFLRPQYIRVPLFFKFPKGDRRIITTPISIIDIAPTLLKYLGFKENKIRYSGMSVFKSKRDRTILSYTYRPESYLNGVSIIHNKFQFIRYRGLKNFEEFIDLSTSSGFYDKDNKINDTKYLNMIKRLEKTSDTLMKVSQRKSKRGKLDEKTKKILKSLGYL